MTSTFLGKWSLYLPKSSVPDWNGPAYASSTDPFGDPAFGMFYGPPGKETNIAFILRADSQLCFLLNNGKYVGFDSGMFPWMNTLAEAIGFAFPGHDYRNLPTPVNSEIHTSVDNIALIDVFGVFLLMDPPDVGPVFTISQITPPLATLQASGKGDGLDFAWVDLTGATLQNVSLIKADFSNCNLTSMDFTGSTLNGVCLDGATLNGTKLSGTHLAGVIFPPIDLTSVIADRPPQFYNTPLQPPSPTNPRTSLAGCRLNQSLVANDWSMLDLTGATILDLSSPPAAEPLKASYAILKGLNKNNLVGLTLQNAVFDYAVLDGLGLNSSDQSTSDLTSASFIQASMHGTNLTGAILKGANMTGAQLGSLSNLFTLPAGYETHLNAGPVDAALRDQFTQHGITLSTSATLNTLEAGRVWQLNDAGNKIIYTVRKEGDSSPVLTVYKPAVSASLVGAYMPDAILTGANLFGITANNIQFYGSNAKLDGSAILEEAKLNDSNLSTVNFTQAQLLGANLSNSHLFNVHFNKANLSPSATGGATDLSYANLQGADFTDAQLYGANLTNSAVAINVPTNVNPKQGGVYLFSLPYSGDKTTLPQYTAELTAAATGFILPYEGDTTTLDQYLTALKNNNLGPLKIAFLKHQPPWVLSANAQSKGIEDGVWQIVDGAQSYTLWTDPDETGTTELYVAPSLTNTQAGFDKHSGITLRWQTSATVDTAGQQWLLDNDSENPTNFSTGYVRFIVKLNGNVLDVYGTALRISRLGDHGEEYDTETCQITTISQTNMNADTICPNGSTLSANQEHSHKDWDDLWLRAATLPPPPTCVPTDYQWCPPQTAKRKKNSILAAD